MRPRASLMPAKPRKFIFAAVDHEACAMNSSPALKITMSASNRLGVEVYRVAEKPVVFLACLPGKQRTNWKLMVDAVEKVDDLFRVSREFSLELRDAVYPWQYRRSGSAKYRAGL